MNTNGETVNKVIGADTNKPGLQEMVIFGEMKQDNAHFTLFALKGDKENIYICLTGELEITEDNIDEFGSIIRKGGLYLGWTEDEINEMMLAEMC